jgi:protein-disulfide isomerase
MIFAARFIAAAAFLGAAACPVQSAQAQAQTQSFTPQQRSEIEVVVRDFLLKNPEILHELMQELEKRQALAETEKAKKAIAALKDEIFNSPHQVTLGNPKGDVTMVEFFDYNCGYCKRAMGDMMELLKSDPNLKVVLKEFPVLGEASVQAAQVAAAVSLQDKSGKKYLDFHRKLMGGRGQADKARALAAAKEAGLDMARLEKDMNGPEVRAALEQSFKLAEALGLNGTPSYVINDEVAIGAVGLAALQQKINTARCGKATC